MKKKLVILLMCFMMIGTGSAFAAASSSDTTDPTVSQMVAPVKKAAVLKAFTAQLHTINNLRETRLETKVEIVKKQDQLLDLTLAAREKGNKDGLKQAAEVRKQIKSLDGEIQGLWNNLNSEMKAFRQAVKDRNSDSAKTHIDSVISLYGQINGKMIDKAGLYDKIITILQ